MKKSEYSSYDGLGIAKLIREKEVNVREVLDTAISIIETYDEDISAITTKAYDHAIKAIEKSVGCPAFIISTSPDRDDIIEVQNPFER